MISEAVWPHLKVDRGHERGGLARVALQLQADVHLDGAELRPLGGGHQTWREAVRRFEQGGHGDAVRQLLLTRLR